MNKELIYKLLFLGIFIIAAVFRFFDLNWDQGFHLHPDERAIVLYTLPLKIPTTINQFLSTSSTWNPHFFAYGSFPLYLLKTLSYAGSFISQQYSGYDGSNLLGRAASVFFDLGTLTCIYFLGKKLRNRSVGVLAAFFYGISVLPIQLSHFYAVDTILTFFLTLLLYLCILFYEKPNIIKSLGLGVLLGFAFATKISAVVILISVVMAMITDFSLLVIKHPLHPEHWKHHLPKFILFLIRDLLVISVFLLITYALLEPYAFLDFSDFWQQTLAQSQMTKDAFTFPYTLQYVGIIPYWYELKNIFLWGLGPILAIITFSGIIYESINSIRKHSIQEKSAQKVIILVFFWAYFLTVGSFAIGFIRYMLPLYPILCLFGAIFIDVILNAIKNPSRMRDKNRIQDASSFTMLRMTPFIHYTLFFILLLILLVWPLSFMHIYSQPNTRVLASNFINQDIPPDTTLAVEHWDDGLPLATQSNYNIQTLALYDQDTLTKWQIIVSQLARADYIIIASNRLYIPIQKLADCNKYPQPHCYPVASVYYKNLFSGKPVLQNTQFSDLPGADRLIFKQIKSFSIFPQIPILNIPINDQGADESFTVYDHPKIMIFKKL